MLKYLGVKFHDVSNLCNLLSNGSTKIESEKDRERERELKLIITN